MNSLRKKAALWFYRNHDKGIPNLMMYIGIGNAIVWALSMIDPSNVLYYVLCFDRSAILRGQIWRLFSYIFTYMLDATGLSILLGAITLICYYFIGRALEQHWGVLRFNCYYLAGILLMDLPCLIFGFTATTYYLNLSLFLAIATLMPDIRFLVFYIIPVKAKYLAWVYFGFVLYDVISSLLSCITMHAGFVSFIYAFLPLIALLNYFLFFGSDIQNILPDFLRYRNTSTQKTFRSKQATSVFQNRTSASSASSGTAYRHKCTVCGRTDVSNPELEFRYCSKCKGFYCYCIDHINNHTHITDVDFH